MNRNIYPILSAALALVAFTGCEKENFFYNGDGEGQLDCRNLSVDYINSGRQTRAAGVNVGDFMVNFVNADNVSVKSCLYSEMPEVVALPAGEYTIHAEYGENPLADWNAPYYLGVSSSSFIIKAGEITSDVDPVECELSNIKIAVNIDDLGLGIIGDDAKVVVKAGDAVEGQLVFDKSRKNDVGYFRYIEGSNTITATFSGTVDGVYIEGESRCYDDASAGNSYVINFTITRPDELGTGDIQIGDDDNDGIFVDATISITDENYVIDPDDNSGDGSLTDDMRPEEEDPITPDQPGGDEPGGDQPGGDQSGTEDPVAKGPQIITLEGLELEKCFVLNADVEVKFEVKSNTGLKEFLINIDSATLTPEELAGFGLSANLDLINPVIDGEDGPVDIGEILSNLGFKNGPDVENQKYVDFDITQFVPMLNALGPNAEHFFHLTISDAEGTTTGTIWLKNAAQ